MLNIGYLNIFAENQDVLREEVLATRDLYRQIACCLDGRSLSALSLVSKHNYIEIYKIVFDVLRNQHKTVSLGPLTFSQRWAPTPNLILGKSNTLPLLKRAHLHIRFTSQGLHADSVARLEGFFPERREIAARIEQESMALKGRHQEWMEDTVFSGSAGAEILTVVQNIRQLVAIYQASPRPPILDALRKAATLFPASQLPQLIEDLASDVDPASVAIMTVIEELSRAHSQSVQHILHIMQDIADWIKEKIKANSTALLLGWGEKNRLWDSLQIGFLANLSTDLLSAQCSFSLEEARALQEMLRSMLQHHRWLQLVSGVPNGRDAFDDGRGGKNLMAQLETELLPLLEKGVAQHAQYLSKRSAHVATFWRALFLEDRESLDWIIQSPACTYFRWGPVLSHLRLWDRDYLGLFVHLLAYPQVIGSIKDEEQSSLAKDLSYRSMCVLTILLGRSDISPVAWTAFVRLMRRNRHFYPDAGVFSIVLNSLVREGKVELVRAFLSIPYLYRQIPFASPADSLTPFLAGYPTLWRSVSTHTTAAAQLLAQILFQYCPHGKDAIRGSAILCMKMMDLLLAYPEIVHMIDLPEECPADRKALIEALLQSVPRECSWSPDHLQHVIRAISEILCQDKEGKKWVDWRCLFQVIRNNADLWQELSTPVDPRVPGETPHQMFDILLGFDGWEPTSWSNKREEPKSAIGWDRIMQNAAGQPDMLALLVNCPAAAIHMPSAARNAHLPDLQKENLEAFASPQEGSAHLVAERMSALIATNPELFQQLWGTLTEKCSFFRRIVLVFTLPRVFSAELYRAFDEQLPLFYRLIARIGKFWDQR